MNGTIRTADGHTVLRFDRRLTHRPEKVWRALTEARHIPEWFPSDMQMDLAVGARIRFVFRNGEAPTLDGSITELDPPRVFAYTWGDDAWLRWEIRPEAEGCLLVFTHTFDDRPAAASFAFGWQTCLNAFEALLDEKPAAPGDDYVTAHEAYVEEFGLLEGSSELCRRHRPSRPRALGADVRPAGNPGVAQSARPSGHGRHDAGRAHCVASEIRRPRRPAARPMAGDARQVVTLWPAPA